MCECVKESVRERCDTDKTTVVSSVKLRSPCIGVKATGVYPHRFDQVTHLGCTEQRVDARLSPLAGWGIRSCQCCSGMIGRTGNACQLCRWVMGKWRRHWTVCSGSSSSSSSWGRATGGLTGRRLPTLPSSPRLLNPSDCIDWVQVFKWVSKGVVGNWFLCKMEKRAKQSVC